ncbi:hypothetical protein DIPPA_22376 [Diplonema papillatum]|nr:hypothetical protein DIPPA_22376 [Diplonema papillatum]
MATMSDEFGDPKSWSLRFRAKPTKKFEAQTNSVLSPVGTSEVQAPPFEREKVSYHAFLYMRDKNLTCTSSWCPSETCSTRGSLRYWFPNRLAPAFSKLNTAAGAPAGEWPFSTTPPSQGAEAPEGGQSDNYAGPTQGGGGVPPRGLEPGTPGPPGEVARLEGLDRGAAPAAAPTPRERTLPPGPLPKHPPLSELLH